MTEQAENEQQEALPEQDINLLNEYLKEMRRLSVLEGQCETTRKELQLKALPLLRRIGSMTLIDPTDGKPKVANVRAPEVLKVDASELFEALLKQEGGDEDRADVIWHDVLKPPEVDTKEGGLFHLACQDGRIKPETIAAVSKYEPRSPHVGFSKLGG